MLDTHVRGTTVPMVSPDTMSAAASFLAREWGDYGYRLGLAGSYPVPYDVNPDAPDEGRDAHTFYVFQCCAADGGRFLIGADRWGNVRHFTGELARTIAEYLRVECHTD